YREKLSSVHDALPPAGDVDEGGTPSLQDNEHLPVALRLRQLDDLDLAAGAVRLNRDRLIGRAWLGRLRLRQKLGALFVYQGIAIVPEVACCFAHSADRRVRFRCILRRLRVRNKRIKRIKPLLLTPFFAYFAFFAVLGS